MTRRTKYLLGVAAGCLVFFALSCLGQNTGVVTATITDTPDGVVWANGTWSINFYNPTGRLPTYTNNGQPVSPLSYPAIPLESNGFMQVNNLPLNNAISPAGTQWTFTFCPNAITGCVTLPPIAVNQAGDITNQVSSFIKSPRFPASGANQYGYDDREIEPLPVPGGFYFSVTQNCQRLWNGSAWNCGAGGTGTGGASPPAMSVQAANATATGLTSDQNILINPTTHTLTSAHYGNLPTITIPDDCPAVVGDGVTDDAVAFQACVHAHPSAHILFRKTQLPGHCDYFFGQPVYPEGGDSQWEGIAGGVGSGVTLCRPAGVTGIWLSNLSGAFAGYTPAPNVINAQLAHIHHLNLVGGDPWVSTTLADYIVPEMLGGTGSNAPGVLINANGITLDHMRITNSAGAGIYVMSSDALYTNIVSATWGQLINGVPSAQIVTDVGHGCSTGMAAKISGITATNNNGANLGGSTASVGTFLTFVNPTTITFPLLSTDSPSGSFNGTGAHLSCNSFQGSSVGGLYGIADLFKVYDVWASGNRGDGIWTLGADSNAGKAWANQFLSNQLNGIREHSFLGNNYDANQTDANGEETPTSTGYLTSYAMTNVSMATNRISFQTTDPNLISQAAYPYQGSHITVSNCINSGPTTIGAAQVTKSGNNYLLYIAVAGAESQAGTLGPITVNNLTMSADTSGYNFNQTYPSSTYSGTAASGVAGSGAGFYVTLPGYAGTALAAVTITGATATNYPTYANGIWWVYSYASGTTTYTARSSPLGIRTNVAAGHLTGCQEKIWSGGQVWATANVTGGSVDATGPASTNLLISHYAEGNQRALRCSSETIIIGGDIGPQQDVTDCPGRVWNQVGMTTNTFGINPLNTVHMTVGAATGPDDAWAASNVNCTPTTGSPPLGSNACNISFSETQPSSYLNTQDWFGFNGSTTPSSTISQIYEYALLLGYAKTLQNSDGNHPPVWIPNTLYLGDNGFTSTPSISISEGTAPPTTGTYTAGSRIMNTAPANGIAEWICTTGGTPGTWTAVGANAQIQSASSSSGCSTGGTSYSSCTVGVTWPTPFVDTNYQVTCTAQNPFTSQSGCGGVAGCQMGYISGVSNKLNSGVTVVVGSAGGNVATVSSVDCIARHN